MSYSFELGADGILRIKFKGDIDEVEVRNYMAEYQTYLEAESVDKPLHTIIEASEVGKASASVRRIFGTLFQDADPRSGRSAIIGASRYIRVLAGFVIKATGTKDLRLFQTEAEAMGWFHSE
jgi:hypothetical protein